MTDKKVITAKDRKLAKGCLECPVCKRARKKQKEFDQLVLIQRAYKTFCEKKEEAEKSEKKLR